jgi:hypothetical protein
MLDIKSRRMRWAGHVARMGGGEFHSGFWWGNQRERDHLEYPRVGGRIILIRIFKKWDWGMDWIYVAQNRAGG